MKRLVALLTAAFMVALLASTAWADDYQDPDGTPDDSNTHGTYAVGGYTEIEKYLITDVGAPLPTVNFTYTVSVPEASADEAVVHPSDKIQVAVPGNPDADDGATVQVYVGIDPELITFDDDDNASDNYSVPKVGKIHFDNTNDGANATDESKRPKAKSDTDTDKGQDYLDAGEQYNTKKLKIYFSDVKFTEPGIYRYYIHEGVDSETAALFSNDVNLGGNEADGPKTWRTIDVYVVNESEADNASLKIQNYVIYEGKVTAAPREDIDWEFNDNYYVAGDSNRGDFDPTLNKADPSVGMTEGATWTYTAANNDTYEYKFEKDNGGWVETYTKNTGEVTVNRNIDTHLSDAYGTVSTPLNVENFTQAKEMGLSQNTITSRTWTAPDNEYGYDGLVKTYEWDNASNKWKVTGHTTGDALLGEPRPNSFAGKLKDDSSFNRTGVNYEDINGQKIHKDENYDALSKTYKVVPSVLQTYVWQIRLTKGTDGVQADETITYTYNTADKKWVADVVVDDTVDYADLPGNATPVGGLTTNRILYSYAYPIELAAQKSSDTSERYDEAAAEIPNGVEAGNKNNVFVNEYETVNLVVAKEVTGNQGSKDKYFKFTITLEKEDAVNLEITADKSHMDTGDKIIKNNATEYNADTMKTANDNGATATEGIYKYKLEKSGETGNIGFISFDIYLQSGEYIELQGIPTSTKYTVVEADANKEGYKTTAYLTRTKGNVDFASDKLDQDVTIQNNDGSGEYTANLTNGITIKNGDHTVTFTNTKNGVIPTGVAVGVIGGASLVAIFIIYFVIRRKLAAR